MFLKLTSILLEYNQQKTIQNLGEKLLQANKKELKPLSSPIEILTKLEQMDPSSNNQYTVWIVRQYIANQFRLEDVNRIYETLATFSKLKNKLPIEQRDIGKFTFHALEDLIDSHSNVKLGDTSVDGLNYKHIDEMEVLYNGPYGKLIIPKTEEASCELGRGTRWCTAASNNNTFDEYNKNGPLYVWIDKSGKKYQLHFETYQMMDDKDEPISREKLDEFRVKNPILSKLFRYKEQEIIKDPNTALDYAQRVIKRRWPEVEPYIMKDPNIAIKYVTDILKRRWPEAEPYIMKDPNTAIKYAIDVIKGRWPEAEPYIMKDPYPVFIYAKDILKGRWPEAEPYIMKDPSAVVRYAIIVLKGRWPEAEPYIMKNPIVAIRYAIGAIKGRWPEAEPYIMKDPSSAFIYAKDILKGRWPEAEPYIMKDPIISVMYKSFLERL